MRYFNNQLVNCLPTLVIDANGPAGEKLANELKLKSFTADIAISCSAAITALRARYYGSMVYVGDISHAVDLRCIAELRRKMPRAWIIVISSTAPSDMQGLFLRYGIDAVLVTPCSTTNLVSRLLAFASHSRPV